MKQLLTDNKIKNLKPKDRAYKTADGTGLYVYTSKSGSKSFRYDFKLHDKWATITYGQYPDISLAEARDLHQETRKQVQKGIDPRLSSKAGTQLKPFSFYAHEKIKTSKLAERTAKKKIQVMEKYFFDYLDKRPVNEITTVELLNLVKPIAQEGKIETARRLATYARQVFNDLIALQLISSNPADRLGELLPPIPEATSLSHTTDLEEISVMLRAFETYQGDFAVKQALCFAPHVFLRPQNIRMLQWSWIDFTNRIISIPQDFMKMSRPHLVPLSRQAFDILQSMKPLTGSKQYVFSAGLNDKPLSENTLSNAVKRAINPKTGKPLGKGFSTAHGLRHMASTLLNEMRFDSDAIELQLSHLDKDRIRRTYNKSNLIAERTKMMQSWSDYLDKLKTEFN